MAVVPERAVCFREEGDADMEGGVSEWKTTSF